MSYILFTSPLFTLSPHSIPSTAGYFSSLPPLPKLLIHSHTQLIQSFRRISPEHLLAWNPNSNAIPLIPPPRLYTIYPNGPDPRYIHPWSLSRVWSSVLSRHCGGGGVGCCRCFSCKWFVLLLLLLLLFWGGPRGGKRICFSLFSPFWIFLKRWGGRRNEVCVWMREWEGQRWGVGMRKSMSRRSKTENRKFQNFILLLHHPHTYFFAYR